MLGVKKLLKKILNCCYIKGSSGNWTWKKYADGTFDAWFSGEVTVVNAGQISSIAPTYYECTANIQLPSQIGSTNILYANLLVFEFTKFLMSGGYDSKTANSIKFHFVRGGGAYGGTQDVECYIHGTWGGYKLTGLKELISFLFRGEVGVC